MGSYRRPLRDLLSRVVRERGFYFRRSVGVLQRVVTGVYCQRFSG